MIRDVMFAVMYGGVGVYVALILFGVLHKTLGESLEGPRRLAAWIMALGFLALGGHHALQYYRFSTPEGQEVLKKMRETEGHVIIGPHE
jgi:predicted aminopeptidase